jgi:hypothetical protein
MTKPVPPSESAAFDGADDDIARRYATQARVGTRFFKVGEGAPDLTELRAELDEMTDVLMGRTPPPTDVGTATLMEVASAYYTRALEITGIIQRLEATGAVITKTSAHYKFRTGELRTFTELAKAATELGSRRISAIQLEFDLAGRR